MKSWLILAAIAGLTGASWPWILSFIGIGLVLSFQKVRANAS